RARQRVHGVDRDLVARLVQEEQVEPIVGVGGHEEGETGRSGRSDREHDQEANERGDFQGATPGRLFWFSFEQIGAGRNETSRAFPALKRKKVGSGWSFLDERRS